MQHPRRRLCALAMAVALPAAAAAQVPVDAEFLVNSSTTGAQVEAKLAVNRDGRFVVAWTDRPAIPGDMDVRAQLFDGLGLRVGAEFLVNTYTTYFQRNPDVAMDARGHFVVVWSGDTNRGGVFAQRYDAQGVRLGGEFAVNTVTFSGFTQHRVEAAPDGGFTVVWTSPLGISGRLFDRAGAPRGPEFQVNSSTPLTLAGPVVAADGAGNLVAAWEVEFAPFAKDILARRFTATGAPIGADFAVNAYTTGRQTRPTVARAHDGAFVVAWTGTDGDAGGILGQRFAADGARLGAEFVVNAYTTGYQNVADVDVDDGGAFVVSWVSETFTGGDRDEVVGQRFDAQGARRGAQFHVNTYTTGYQLGPLGFDADPVGNFTVVWASDGQDGSDLGNFGQRFGALRPTAVAVDSVGNNVLEPGETVALRPSWMSLSGAQTFTGHLDGFTGPAGATYSIADADADYGTVAGGATGSCGADCYQISVSDPPARPAAHWDTVALEKILPDVHGQAKRWTIHVGRSFTDVPASNPFYRFVETMVHNRITGGCGPGLYCPSVSTTRQQMTVFILLASEGSDYLPPACTIPPYNDVPVSSPFCRWIAELTRRMVVAGCGSGNFCPDNPVNREQMAVFLVRVREPNVNPPACVPPNVFFDVPETSPFCRWIEHLVSGNVTAGCGNGNYCPLAILTREQMAVFLTVIFGLSLYAV